MKKNIVKVMAFVLMLCMVLPMAACGGGEKENTAPINESALIDALLNQVEYDSVLAEAENAGRMFQDMPEGATVTVYSGTGYCADEVVVVKLLKESDSELAIKSIKYHIQQMRDQFASYNTAELPKIDGAVIWDSGLLVIACVTNDHAAAKELLKNPPRLTGDVPDDTTVTTLPGTTVPMTTLPVTTVPPTTAPGNLNSDGYPAIISDDTNVRTFSACYVVGNMAYEMYSYNSGAAEYYAELVSHVADQLAGEATVYSLIIPTAIGVVFPDNLKDQVYDAQIPQGQKIDEVYAMMSDNVVGVNCFDRLMQHRDEYLYFRTDWHWTGTGAYYAYEQFCADKGITPYTMEQRQCSVFEGYLGGLYTQTTGGDSALRQTPDTVYAYHCYNDVDMVYTTSGGSSYSWPVIMDVSGYDATGKYLCFAAGDQPYAKFTNPAVTDGSVAIVVKESFGNVLMSYVADHYSTVYEIDYRHWNGDLVSFAREVGATDILFANNIGMVRSSYLIGMMDKIIN